MDQRLRIPPRPLRVQIDRSKFCNAAIDRYLAEEREATKDPASTQPQQQGSQDVEMELIRSSDIRSRRCTFQCLRKTTVTIAAAGTTSSSISQRVRISAISDPTEFTGKDQDEDRAQAWISKAISLFMQDQISDDEKCLTFADLLAGSAKNRQYYHTRRRTDDSTLNYLYRLNVRARFKIKDGNAEDRRVHVDHSLETLEDEDLAELRPFQIQAADSGSASGSDESGGSESDIDSHRRIPFVANVDVTPKMEKVSNPNPRLPDRDHNHQDHNSKIHGF
ncbi:hypothetical protein PHMEG_00013817 [Phytophthora megakarya]|uniref:Uncharacterized protein n=1 Tax=Phytophthora megakarya TaxID=4795 RepID=A0A225W5F8_9STRA|nr:hypothetical protein PHMEG_00013817 [Phytophthora megakarya]